MTLQRVELGKLIELAKAPRARNCDYPILSMTMAGGLVDQSRKFKKRVASSDTSNYKVVNRGQLVVGFPIDEGVLAFQEKYDAAIVSPAYDVWSITDQEIVFRPYLERFLRSPKALSFYKGKLQSTTARRRTIPIDTFLSLPIPVPKETEQRRIAAILDQADALRCLRQRAIDRLNQLGQSIFNEMFGEGNDPTRGDLIPLTEFFNFRTGKLDSNAATASGNYPFFTCSKDDFLIDEYAFDCEALLLAGNNASADYSVKHYKGKFNAYQRTYVLNLADNKNSYPYAKAALQKKLNELKRASKGTNTKYLTMAIFEAMKILVPPKNMQAIFEDRISRLDNVMRHHQRAIEVSGVLFTSLQQRAFRGEL